MAENSTPHTVVVVGPEHPGLTALRERLRERGALLAHTNCLPQAQRWLDTLAPDLIVSTRPLLPALPCRQLAWDGELATLEGLMHELFPKPRLRTGSLQLDEASGRLTLTAQPHAAVTLPSTELRLLLCLLRHRGKAVSRQTLISEAWTAGEHPQPRSVDQVVHRLRELLAPLGLAERVRALRGLGYRFDLDGLEALAKTSQTQV